MTGRTHNAHRPPSATIRLLAAAVVAWMGTDALAQDAVTGEAYGTSRPVIGSIPYQPIYAPQQTNSSFGTTRIVVPARLHREVEVSRTLAAQPVHPHMVKVILGGGRSAGYETGANPVISTWIDPLRRLDGANGLDENHSLVKAQRLYLSLSGTTQRQIDEARVQSHRIQRTYASQSNARIITNPAAMRDDGPHDVQLQRVGPTPYHIPHDPGLHEPADRLIADRASKPAP